jgi:hypothetical protein
MTDSEPKVADPYMQKMLFGMKSKQENDESLSVPPLEEDNSDEDTESEHDEEELEEEEDGLLLQTPSGQEPDKGQFGPIGVSDPSIDESKKTEELKVETPFVQEKPMISKVEDSVSCILMRMEMMNGEIFRKLDMICNRIEHIEERLTHIEECQKFSYAEFSGEIIKIKEIKLESYPISDQDVMKALVYHDHRSFMYIFKLYYRSIQGGKIFYPIRMKNRRTFEYYYGGRWILDPSGHQTIKILCSNIQNLFLKHNIIENKFIEENQWYLNQEFIMKLSEERYKKEIWKHVVGEIMTASA